MIFTLGPKLHITGLSSSQLEEVKTLCTFKNPAWKAWERQNNLYPKFKKEEPDKYIFTFEQKNNEIYVPTYLKADLILKFRPDKVIDRRVDPILNIKLNKNFEHRTGQEEAVNVLYKNEYGTLSAPCGSGKTTMALSLIHKLNRNAIILVHTDLLLKQTILEVKNKLGVEAGIIGGGKWDIKPITVATVQTLARRDLSEIKKYFGVLVSDEVQFFAAPTFVNVIQQFHAKYKYGFSATPTRSDGLDAITAQTLGPVIHKIDTSVPQKAGATIKPTYEFIDTPYVPKRIYDSWQLPQHINALTKDKKRNEFIVQKIKKDLKGFTLVLTDRIEHLVYLEKELQCFNPEVYHGKLTKKERQAIKEKWLNKSVKLTIATVDSLGVGTDVPFWEEVWLTTPTSNFNRLTQIAGRVSRMVFGKTYAKIWDFTDPNDPVLALKAKKRKEIYEQL